MITEVEPYSPPGSTNMGDTPTDPQASAITQQPEEWTKVFDYNIDITTLRRTINEWDDERKETIRRRLTRDVEVNTESLRQSGKLDEDETLIPVRVIDVNIQREQPAYINYLKNSRRLATFNCLSVPDLDTQEIELEFTRGMTYLSWETAHFKTIDGAQTHGWDSVEVVFNPLFPLNVGIEHIGHDKLIFPRGITDLQASPLVIRIYEVTKIQLDSFVKDFGFDPEQVALFFASRKDTQKENEPMQIYKKFCKYKGIVYVAWFSHEQSVTNWLKQPEPAFVGISKKETVMELNPLTGIPEPLEQWVNEQLTQYPIFLLPYRESEKPRLMDRKGRVFLDEPKQEAQTAILSGFVNGLTRAANIYGSPGAEDGSGAGLRELDNIKLVGGRVLNKPFQFWHPDYPDPMVLRALQYFDVSNSQETNQLNFAAMNRDDSRKTATELEMSQSQTNLMNTVSLTLFSTHIRAIYSLVWLIVQSQAMQNKIVFMRRAKAVPIQNPLTGQPVIDANTGQPVTETVVENDYQRIEQVYDVRAAGDIDVVQRQEKLNQMMQDWPVISQTPLAIPFLQDMLRLKYPDKGESYAQAIAQSGQMEAMKGMIGRLSTVLEGALQQNPEQFQQLSAQDKADLASMMQQAKQMTGTPPQK